jgi:hypothetical protein
VAYWDGAITPTKKEWLWVQKRAWLPFTQCQRSHKFLFLKKAYYGRYYVDWQLVSEQWLSPEEYMLKVLRDD